MHHERMIGIYFSAIFFIIMSILFFSYRLRLKTISALTNASNLIKILGSLPFIVSILNFIGFLSQPPSGELKDEYPLELTYYLIYFIVTATYIIILLALLNKKIMDRMNTLFTHSKRLCIFLGFVSLALAYVYVYQIYIILILMGIIGRKMLY